jgi:hypothetical protein
MTALTHAGEMRSCRSCGADVVFVPTPKGKLMPLDPDERSDGNVVIEADGKARVLPAGDPYTGPRFVSHFSTCPDAPAWRKRA